MPHRQPATVEVLEQGYGDPAAGPEGPASVAQGERLRQLGEPLEGRVVRTREQHHLLVEPEQQAGPGEGGQGPPVEAELLEAGRVGSLEG